VLTSLQMAAPVLELDEEDGEDAVAEELRRLQEAANDLQLRFDKADMELKEAQLNEDRCGSGVLLLLLVVVGWGGGGGGGGNS
jgi:hypothetical protein